MAPGKSALRRIVVPTSYGDAEVAFDQRKDPKFLLLLTHGAAGGVESTDLIAVRKQAVAQGGAVARIMQPYRVAGGRAPGSPVRQDAAWVEIAADLQKRVGAETPLIQGGRSNGARVACRTAGEVGARGIIALAFPLHPPGKPEKSRADELRGAGVEVVVINGDRDPFGVPDAKDAALVHVLAGETHALKKDPAQIAAVVEPWLEKWSV